jgi:hypothetical protein
MDIRIDTSRYEARHGKPNGKRVWSFTIVSPTMTIKDHYFRTHEAVTFSSACTRARQLAILRRSKLMEPD